MTDINGAPGEPPNLPPPWDGEVAELTTGWEFVGIVFDGDPIEIEGVSPWSAGWDRIGSGQVVVAHPAFPWQRHEMSVYRLERSQPPIYFAAGEFSNTVWGFFRPTAETRRRLAALDRHPAEDG